MALPNAKRGAQLLLVGAVVMGLSACIDPQVGVRRTTSTSQATVPHNRQPSELAQHIVQKGDTLYAIAFRYALDYRDIARWNGISDPYIIKPDQRLVLRDPSLASPRPIEPAPVATTQTAPSYTASVPSTVQSSNVPNTTPAQIGTAAPVSQGVSVGGTVPDSQLASVEPLSPTNAEGLPTGFASSATASTPQPAGAVANTSGSTLSSTTPAPTAPSHPDVPSAPPPELMAPKPSTVAVIQAPTLSTSSAAKPPAGANGWGWPVIGRVLTTFSSSDPGRQGVDISGNMGDPVHAAKGGDVVYSGRGIIGYGELIVIKHDDATLTAYGHNDKRSVKEGERVAQGQKIAEMGKAPNGQSLLHFEVRRNGKPIDPLSVLPARR